MKALIYHGPEKKNWESKADPAVERATDAVVRIDTTTICGTDLHILKGDVPTVTDGRTLGHEGVGTVAVVGAGPIGLASMLTAGLYGPSRIIAIDLADSRLAQARRFGADTTINNSSEDPVERVMELTDGLGADVAMEAVGVPATFEMCAELVRPGGHVANLGVHGRPATLHLENLWIKNVTITTGLVDTYSTPTLLRLVAEGRLDPTAFATHRFGLAEIMDAYDTFADATRTDALKVVLSAR